MIYFDDHDDIFNGGGCFYYDCDVNKWDKNTDSNIDETSCRVPSNKKIDCGEITEYIDFDIPDELPNLSEIIKLKLLKNREALNLYFKNMLFRANIINEKDKITFDEIYENDETKKLIIENIINEIKYEIIHQLFKIL